jgi:hypothetical protein
MKRAGEVDGLVHALRHRRPKVRCRAAEALGQLCAVEAADDLVAALEDEQDWLARRCLVSALNQLGDERALEPALADLRALEADARLPGGGTEDAYWVGRDAGRVRSPELVDRLVDLAHDERWIVRLGVAYASRLLRMSALRGPCERYSTTLSSMSVRRRRRALGSESRGPDLLRRLRRFRLTWLRRFHSFPSGQVHGGPELPPR